MDTVKYLNEVIVRLEESFITNSRMRFLEDGVCGDRFHPVKEHPGKTLDEIVTKCIKRSRRRVSSRTSPTWWRQGVLLRLKIKGCIHLPKEVQLKKDGVAPYICRLPT